MMDDDTRPLERSGVQENKDSNVGKTSSSDTANDTNTANINSTSSTEGGESTDGAEKEVGTKPIFEKIIQSTIKRAIRAVKHNVSGKSLGEIIQSEWDLYENVVDAVRLSTDELMAVWRTYDVNEDRVIDKMENRRMIRDYFTVALDLQPELILQVQQAAASETMKSLPPDVRRDVLMQFEEQKGSLRHAVRTQMLLLLQESDRIADNVWRCMDEDDNKVIDLHEFLEHFQTFFNTGFQIIESMTEDKKSQNTNSEPPASSKDSQNPKGDKGAPTESADE